jgi:NADPH:quinone reductase-like Zn-dependent oxidoreductase
MRAAVLADFGQPVSTIDLPLPEPGPGEVRVRIRASSVNGFDLAVAAGYTKDWMEHRFPVVLGRDFAGTIDTLGPGATRFAVGDPVFGVVITPVLGDGGFAEYVVVSQDSGIVPIPAGVDLATAGAIGLAGTSAVLAIEAVAPDRGETVLISGAPGGVGSFAVQLAASRGAEVIATAKPGPQTDFVQRLGATHVIDREGDVAAQVRALHPHGVDAVIHLGGDAATLAGLLAPGGRMASLLVMSPEQFGTDGSQRAIAVVARPDSAILENLGAGIAAGSLRVPIHASYRLEDVPAAFENFATGKTGKIAIAIDNV